MKIICDCGRHIVIQTEKPGRPYWSKTDDKWLGKVSDTVLALRMGKTVKAIERRRERLGIPSFNTSRNVTRRRRRGHRSLK